MINLFTEKKVIIEKKPDNLIFEKRNIFITLDILSKLLRKIFYSKKITFRDFTTMHNKYADSIGLSKLERYSDRNNLLKGISNDTITFRLFRIVLERMGYLIVKLDIKLYNKNTSQIESFSVSVNEEKNKINENKKK